MKIIYISSFVSDKLFNDLVSQSLTTGYVGQKYHGMFIRGLVKNLGDNNVVALSQPPINKRFCKLKEAEDGIKIRYVPIIPIPIIKQTIYFIYSFFYALYWGLRNIHEDKVIICSIMRIYQYIPIRIASLFFGKCKKITVACDVPWMTTIQVSGSKSKLSPKVRLAIWMSKKMCASFDMYIVLTEEMSKVLNPYNKPYIVVEGFCDVRMNDIQNHLTDKYEKDIVIYAGGLNKEYGILELVQAVRSIENENRGRIRLGVTGEENDPFHCGKLHRRKHRGTHHLRTRKFGIL